MALQENINEVVSPGDAKRRLLEWGASHDAAHPWRKPLITAAAAGAGIALAARILRRAPRAGPGLGLGPLLMAVRVLAPLAASILVAKRSDPGAPRLRARTRPRSAGADGNSSHAVSQAHRGW